MGLASPLDWELLGTGLRSNLLNIQAAGTQQMLHNCLLDENTHHFYLVTDRKSFKDFKQEFHKTEVWLAPAQKVAEMSWDELD